MNAAAPSMLKPTLIAGVITGVVASIPLLGDIAMMMCCAPIIGCGLLAAFLYSKECKGAGAPFRAGRGAMVGWVSGVWFAIIVGVVGGAIDLLMGSGDPIADFMQQMESSPFMTPETMEQMEGVMGSLQDIPIFVWFLGGLVFSFVLASIFATIGGAIGGAVFKVEEEAPAIQP